MNFNLCPTCGADVACGDDCEKPKCVKATAAIANRSKELSDGRMAFNCFAATLVYKPMWNDLLASTKDKWIAAAKATPQESQ